MPNCENLNNKPEGSDLTVWVEWAEEIDDHPTSSEYENMAGQYDFPLFSKKYFEELITKSILQLRWDKGHGTRKGDWINEGLGQLGQLLKDKLKERKLNAPIHS